MAVQIQSFARVVPMIYAYTTPGVPYHEGWTKIGYTERQKVEDRIRQQTHTAGVKTNLEWQDNALYKDGSGDAFTDRDFHDWLEGEKRIERKAGREWFRIDGMLSLKYFNAFASRKTESSGTGSTYALRKEQQDAVDMTRAYFESGGEEFLWNAKPRFGKTLSSYDLVQRMGFEKVLIVSNRPSISNSWVEDFRKFVGWRGEYLFVSNTEALSGKQGVLSREEYLSRMLAPANTEWKKMIAFESLQGLKGSVYFGGEYDKLKWISEFEFDLLIVDEAQEGVETLRTERAFNNIRRKHTLFLSGTPFKQLAGDRFSSEQIFNWSYADEQDAKKHWPEDGETNPYETLPRLALFTYQLSNMIYDEIQKGLDLGGEDGEVDYAFDLNEFFATNDSGKFIHEAEIKKFLHALTTQEKYPFSTPELRQELSHTMWLLNRVASAKALAKLLADDPVFGEYEIVLAAGDGRLDEDAEIKQSYDRVRKAIAEKEKTITLSVGQLTVGVTIPEWSGVLMLCNLQSPSSYMQAAFRAQNPCMIKRGSQKYRKDTAYVFDFDPARTLIIFDEFANNLRPKDERGGTTEDRRENIKNLLNFFPVLGEDSEGKMVELDAAQVLSIPRKLKSAEVVRRGFMSNFLFQNIANVFGAPAAVRAIIEKMEPAQEEKINRRRDEPLRNMENVAVDEDGNVAVSNKIVIGRTQGLFGSKVYDEMISGLDDPMARLKESDTPDAVKANFDRMVKQVEKTVIENVVAPVADEYEMKRGAQNRLEDQVKKDIQREFARIHGDYAQQTNVAKIELERKRSEAETADQAENAEKEYNASIAGALQAFTEAVLQKAQETIQEKPKELVEKLEKEKAEKEKRGIEDEIRAHLRGFSRTIPSFIMAYGDGQLTLANFDEYTEEDVFLEVTGITLENFRFLRDGGPYTDPDTGEEKRFRGHLFDEVVFDDSVMEFWNKKQALADYFDEEHEEDIFDYIPPQKTNQIFTPKWVVKKMVDALEENNPGCFDDPNNTFADLYMKSGLYITEIVKRLFRSEAMKTIYPDDGERIRHILQKQVYGMAPTRIIYLISTNYILGFDAQMLKETHNFVEADAAEASKNGALARLVDESFA